MGAVEFELEDYRRQRWIASAVTDGKLRLYVGCVAPTKTNRWQYWFTPRTRRQDQIIPSRERSVMTKSKAVPTRIEAMETLVRLWDQWNES